MALAGVRSLEPNVMLRSPIMKLRPNSRHRPGHNESSVRDLVPNPQVPRTCGVLRSWKSPIRQQILEGNHHVSRPAIRSAHIFLEIGRNSAAGSRAEGPDHGGAAKISRRGLVQADHHRRCSLPRFHRRGLPTAGPRRSPDPQRPSAATRRYRRGPSTSVRPWCPS